MWRVGPIPCAIPPTSVGGGGGGGGNAHQSPYLHSLGDTAVDFDIAPPRVVSTGDDTRDVNSSQINVCIHTCSYCHQREGGKMSLIICHMAIIR